MTSPLDDLRSLEGIGEFLVANIESPSLHRARSIKSNKKISRDLSNLQRFRPGMHKLGGALSMRFMITDFDFKHSNKKFSKSKRSKSAKLPSKEDTNDDDLKSEEIEEYAMQDGDSDAMSDNNTSIDANILTNSASNRLSSTRMGSYTSNKSLQMTSKAYSYNLQFQPPSISMNHNLQPSTSNEYESKLPTIRSPFEDENYGHFPDTTVYRNALENNSSYQSPGPTLHDTTELVSSASASQHFSLSGGRSFIFGLSLDLDANDLETDGEMEEEDVGDYLLSAFEANINMKKNSSNLKIALDNNFLVYGDEYIQSSGSIHLSDIDQYPTPTTDDECTKDIKIFSNKKNKKRKKSPMSSHYDLYFTESESVDSEVLNKQISFLDHFPSEDFKEYPLELMQNIGHGAFGIVTKAFHYKSCETVAIKSCRSNDKKAIQLFFREGKLYQKFAYSEFIIKIIGLGNNEHSGKLCMAMEFMDMSSLDNITHALSECQVQYIAYCVLNALKELHMNLYVHNDIKPDNILISSLGCVKLADFGLVAIMKDSKTPLTTVRGVIRYHSPEKWLVTPVKYNTKSDIWSLGITLYELLSGTVHQLRDGAYIQPPIIENGCSQHTCQFLEYMLFKNPKLRWSADQLLQHSFITHPTPKMRPFVTKMKKKESDLQFMIDSLVEYYSSRKLFHRSKQGQTLIRTASNATRDPKSMSSPMHIQSKIDDGIVIVDYENYTPEMSPKKRVSILETINNSSNNYLRVNGNIEQLSDEERIANLCKHSGCTKEEVTLMIKYAVELAKQQFAKSNLSTAKLYNSNTSKLLQKTI